MKQQPGYYLYSSYLSNAATTSENKLIYPSGMVTYVATFLITGYPVKLHFQISCVFCPTAIFPVPIYVSCGYYIYETDLADSSSLKNILRFSRQILKYLFPLEPENLQHEQTKFPMFSLCLGKISNFLCFFVGHFPCFPCAVGTLYYGICFFLVV